jgi:hypothetical protein
MCPPEKSEAFTAFTSEQSVLCSPVYLRIITKYGHYSRISAQSERKPFAVQTVWRIEWDSNSRYAFGDPPRGDMCASYTIFCNMNVQSYQRSGTSEVQQ